MADCICLSALDKISAVPVDVHILRVARERGIPAAACSTLTPKSYRAISDSLTILWGDWAGWAQAVSDGLTERSDSDSKLYRSYLYFSSPVGDIHRTVIS